jgi:hypothetical protein
MSVGVMYSVRVSGDEMTTTTRTSTFTVTNARYIASKVSSDLRQVQRLYGKPSDDQIGDYLLEIVILLAGGWLDEVSYGFRRNEGLIPPVLSYKVNASGNLAADARSGGVVAGANVVGASWHSYLRTTQAWSDLPKPQRESIESTLPFARTIADEPGVSNGYWAEGDRTYSSGGVGMVRKTLRPA